MRKIYVLRLSELTPREGCREKGLSSDSPRGAVTFLCAHWLPWDNSSKVELSSHTQKRPAVPWKWASFQSEEWVAPLTCELLSIKGLKHSSRVEMPASRESWSLPQEIKSPNKVLLSANWNLPHSGGSLPQTFRLRCRSNPSA